MTHIERFIMLVTALDGRPPTERRLREVAEDFISYRRDQVEAAGFDPDSKMAKAQRASVFLDAISHHVNAVQEAMTKRRAAS